MIREPSKWSMALVVALTIGVVLMASGLIAEGRVNDARESIVALEDSVARRDSAIAVLRNDNVRDSLLLAQKDSAVAVDTVTWRKEREDLVVRAQTADARANSRARALRPSLDSAQMVELDTILADKDSTIAFQTRRGDNAEAALADITDLYSGAQRLLAGINVEMGLLRMDIVDLKAIVAEQRIVIDWHENPPLAKKLVDAIPGGAIGTLVGAAIVYLVVTAPVG